MFWSRSDRRNGEAARKQAQDASLELRAESAGLTDRGCVRRSNQDAFAIRSDLGLYVVCDGMGGVAGGEIASAVAVETFLTVFVKEIGAAVESSQHGLETAMRRAAAAADRAVKGRAAEDLSLKGMGTTLVAAHVSHERLTVLNIGDSRAYLVHDGAARQISADHSWVAERVREGLMTPAQAERSGYQFLITRAVGTDGDVRPDVFTEILAPGDTVLLNSDGLTRHVTDAEIGQALDRPKRELSVLCRGLIERAKRRGGSDNITCVAIRIIAAPTDEVDYSGGLPKLGAVV